MQSDQNYQELLSLLANNLDTYFPELVMKYQSQLYRFALRLLQNNYETEDALQTVMTNAYFSLKRFPRERILALKLDAWLYTITRHECLKRMQAIKKDQMQLIPLEELTEEIEGNISDSPESLAEARADLDEALKLIEGLSPRYRKALLLYLSCDVSMAEIARLLNAPIGSVKSSIYRGQALLRQSLQKNSLSDRLETR